jgi:4-amino-4-deoxy-L-arabinose transferase-like glycosyltransferase
MKKPLTTRLRAALPRLVDPLIALGLMVAYAALLLSTVRDLGYARDEGFYFAAASTYEAWFRILFTDPARAFEQSNVDRFWSANHEHPALMKSLFALSHHFLWEKWRLLSEQGTAYRFPGIAISAVAVGVTYLWGRRAVCRSAGLVAALLFALMPRTFYNAHLACFDMPVAAMWLITSYAYWRSWNAGGLWWPIATGLLYGLLLNTKHNSWLLPPALVLHLLLVRGLTFKHELRAGRFAVPSALIAMVVIGPLLFYATWPWIWFDTGRRFADYVAFHTGHEYYNMEFLGQTYWKPPMPRLYAWLMTAGTVPGITLLLFVIGLALAGRSAFSHLRSRSVDREAQPDYSTHVLWFVCILTSYAPWLSTNTPIFGGTKHWLTAYPFLCLFAGRGFWLVGRRLAALVPGATDPSRGRGLLVRFALFACVILAPLAITIGSHPWGLSAYTPLVGGAPGAASLGLNRTYWGYTTGAIQDELNRRAPPNAGVYIHDTAVQSWDMMRADGRVRADLRGTLGIHDSSIAIYHHEPHMGKIEYQIWIDYGTLTPFHVGAYHGVPVIWLYERPPPR